MAKRSLFAILIDQPWWASALVTALVYALGTIVSPLIGAAAAFPFACVTLWVIWLRLRRGPALDVPGLLKALRGATPEELREMLVEIYRAQRYEISDAAEGDLKLERNGYITLVRFRRWRAQSAGLPVVKEFQASMQKLQADHGIYITAGVVADNAREHAGRSDILLLDGAALAALVGRSSGARKALRRAAEEPARS